MAHSVLLINSDQHHQKMISTVIERQPLMQLRDYLTDDLSSCSSKGFKSFPRRRHCCTTVRFLLELDLTQKDGHRPRAPDRGPRVLKRSRSVSALHRASEAVVSAVKQLKARLIRGSKKPDGRPRLILAKEQSLGPSDENTGRDKSKSKSTISWCESETGLSATSGGLSSVSSLAENDAVESQNDVSFRKVNKSVDSSTTVGEAIKEWSINEEEKEQFSPVSVLDDPFKDDNDHDDHATSPNSYSKVPRFKGAKRKILLKIKRLKSIAHLKPTNLEKRIAMSEIENKLSTLSAPKDEINRNCEERARELAKTIKSKNGCLGSKADSLMFDFFKERAMGDGKNNMVMSEKESLEVMEDWLNGETKEVFLGWEVKEGREAYLKDLERHGKWTKVDEEVEEIGLDLEARVWDSLVQELLLDLL